MRFWFSLGVLSLAWLSTGAASDEARWIRMRSPNFDMYSTAGEKSARETLRYFEQVHGFFDQIFGDTKDSPNPVRIIAFNSKKEFEPYRINEFAIAYYQGGAEHEYIVLSHTGAETFPIAVHEYVHLLVRHANLKFPPWLNEGMAELYSILKPDGDKILVGSLIPGRYLALQRDKWTPLSTILNVDHKSPYYNEKDKAGGFYNESWALTHMLVLNNNYRPGFSQLVAAIRAGMSSEEALTKTYGKPLARIEKDLQSYLSGTSFQGMLFPAKLEKVSGELSAEPAPAFDVKLMLVDLVNRPGREEETQKTLERLAQEEPNRPEPQAALGYLVWRRGHSDQALSYFQKAVDLGGNSPKLLWDYGRMATRSNPPGSIQALRALLAAQPERVDARLELAGVYLSTNQGQAALATLAQLQKVDQADASKYFRIAVYAYLQGGNREEARKAAEKYAAVAKTDEEISEAQRFMKAVSQERLPAVVGTAAPSADPGRPKLERRERPEFTVTEILPSQPKRPSVKGSFVQLICEGEWAKLVLQTPAGKKMFLIDDPHGITLLGKTSTSTDLSCGSQKPAPVRIEYDASTTPGVEGLVRLIEFNPK